MLHFMIVFIIIHVVRTFWKSLPHASSPSKEELDREAREYTKRMFELYDARKGSK